MKYYKKVTTVRDILDKEVCDWCGKEVELGDNYEVNDFELNHKTGWGYPEGGDGEKIEVDLCFQCRKKLIEELEKLGIKIRRQEWDY